MDRPTTPENTTEANLPSNSTETAPTDGAPPTEEPPSSFSRVPLLPKERKEPPTKSGRRLGRNASKDGNTPPVNPEPVDQEAITRANLAAAPIVGVVGYGPGTGGGSGIRRHTPSCDFCKRRKERCTGGPPCQTCAARKIECTFNTVNRAHFDRRRAKGKDAEDQTAAPLPELAVAGEGVDESATVDGPSAEAGPSSPPEEKPPRTFKKRGKVSELACTFCRERRKKCTAEKPACQNCRKRGIECAYSDIPRNRKGGRKRKEPLTAATVPSQAPPSQHVVPTPSIPSIPIIPLPIMAPLHMPLPILSPSSCHSCRDGNVACDRRFPACTQCSGKSEQCLYDPFAPDISQLAVWPHAMPLANFLLPAAVSLPTQPGASTGSAANLPPGNVPFVDVNAMIAYWTEIAAQGQAALALDPSKLANGIMFPQQLLDPATILNAIQAQNETADQSEEDSQDVGDRPVDEPEPEEVEMMPADQLVDDADGEDEDMDALDANGAELIVDM